MTLDVRSLGSKTSASLISHFLLQQTNKHIKNLCTDLKNGFVVNYLVSIVLKVKYLAKRVTMMEVTIKTNYDSTPHEYYTWSR